MTAPTVGQVTEADRKEDYALVLMFFSDGVPSDALPKDTDFSRLGLDSG